MTSTLNLLRVFLLVLTFSSFVPQYRRILHRGESDGISPTYVLLNLIVATQQFSLYLLYVIDDSTVADFLVESPPSAENYLGLAQFGMVWLCQLILFILCLVYKPQTHSPSPRWPVVVGYAFFLLITLIPVLWMWTLPPSSNKDFYHNRNGPVIFYEWLHMWHVNYIITIVAFAAAVPQVRGMHNRSDPGALSLSGLGLQALVFTVVAISWSLRLQWGTGVLRTVRSWYEWVGWAPLDNAGFAITQMIVWWIAYRFEKPLGLGETRPLLR